MKIKYLIPILITILSTSCKKDSQITEEPVKTGKISFQFFHYADGQPLVVDTMEYINAAGNHYDINEIQYFISDITLHRIGGDDVVIKEANGIHYIDTDIPSTRSWTVSDAIPVGNYTSMSFTFGINQIKNQSLMFVNPPENDMMWPDYIGGGYHYMKMNGHWKDLNNIIQPFGFHLGIGQIYDSVNHSTIIGFVQNYFTVTMPNSSFSIVENATTKTGITMNIESWFATPHVYDLNVWGGSIMQNQAAMHTVAENGADAFSFQLIP